MTTTTDSGAHEMQQANATIGINLLGVGLVFLADNFIARQPLGFALLFIGAGVYLWSRRTADYAFFTLGLAFAGVGLWFVIMSALNLTVLGLHLGGSTGPEAVSLVSMGLPLAAMALGAYLYLRKNR